MRSDFNMAFVPHPVTKDIGILSSKNAIKQSIRNLIMTNYYDRGFNVNVSTNVANSLFEPMDNAEVSMLTDRIKQVIRNFEPDIELVDILASHADNDPNDLTLSLIYNQLNDPEDIVMNIPIRLLR